MTWVWIDEWLVLCALIGVGIAVAQRYLESRVFKTLMSILGILIGVVVTAVNSLRFHFSALIYLAVLLIVFLLVYYPILTWLPHKLKRTGVAGVYIPMDDDELAIWDKLKHDYGDEFSRRQIRIIIAMRRGRKTAKEIAKFVNRPVKEVWRDLDELRARGVLKPD